MREVEEGHLGSRSVMMFDCHSLHLKAMEAVVDHPRVSFAARRIQTLPGLELIVHRASVVEVEGLPAALEPSAQVAAAAVPVSIRLAAVVLVAHLAALLCSLMADLEKIISELLLLVLPSQRLSAICQGTPSASTCPNTRPIVPSMDDRPFLRYRRDCLVRGPCLEMV